MLKDVAFPHIALPFIFRTYRKIAEARFFLDKVEHSEGQGSEFDYYLSAFLAATRNVGWILQAELRGTFGEEFDVWWEAAKARMPQTRISFAVLTSLRNQSVKTGELLAGFVLAIRLRDKLGSIEVVLRSQKGRLEPEQIRITWNRPVIVTTPGIAARDDGESLQGVMAQVTDALRDHLQGAEVDRIGYCVDLAQEPLSFSQMIAGFRELVETMELVVDDAKRTFESRATSTRGKNNDAIQT